MCSSGRPSCPIRTMLNCIYSSSTALQKKSPAAEPARLQSRAFIPTTGRSRARETAQLTDQILSKRWNDFLSLMVFCSFVNKIGVYEGWVALSDTWTTHMWIFAQTAICVLGPFGSRQSTWKPSVTLQNVEKNSQVNESPAANLQKLWKLFRKPPAVGTYQVKVLTLIKPWAFSQSKRCLLTCSREMTTKTMATVYRFLGNQSSNAAMQPLV